MLFVISLDGFLQKSHLPVLNIRCKVQEKREKLRQAGTKKVKRKLFHNLYDAYFKFLSFRSKIRFCSPLRRPGKITLTGDTRLLFSSYTGTWWNPLSRSGGTGFRCRLACQEFSATIPPPLTTTVAPTSATNSSAASRCGKKRDMIQQRWPLS